MQTTKIAPASVTASLKVLTNGKLPIKDEFCSRSFTESCTSMLIVVSKPQTTSMGVLESHKMLTHIV